MLKFYNAAPKGVITMSMPTNNQIQEQVIKLNAQVAQLAISNSNLNDEISLLKNNYGKLVEEVNLRLEAVHKKVFR